MSNDFALCVSFRLCYALKRLFFFIVLVPACSLFPSSLAFIMYCCRVKVVFVPLCDEEGWEETFPCDK